MIPARPCLGTLVATILVLAGCGEDTPQATHTDPGPQPPAATPAPVQYDILDLAAPAKPHAEVGLATDAAGLHVEVAIACLGGETPRPVVGVAAVRPVILEAGDAAREVKDGIARFTWVVPAKQLVDAPADWQRLRLGVAARWAGGPQGGDRRRERWHLLDNAAPAAPLPSDPQAWAPVDLADLAQRSADQRARLLVRFDQPMDGRYTVVIEDAAGKRIRNLASGLPAAKGPMTVEWDGSDEDGRLVAPGTYRWRAVSHPGITPQYAMSFANADETGFRPLLSNHCHFIAAASNGDLAVLAAVGTEGGFAMAAFDQAGHWKQGFNPILGAGWNAVAVAMDGKHLYAAHDGEGWGTKIDKSKPGWHGDVALTLTRFDLASGGVVDYRTGDKQRWSELERHAWGPGAPAAALRTRMSLTGMAMLGGRLYVGSRASDALLVVDPETGKTVDRIPLPHPGAIAADATRLVALSDGTPMLVDPAARSAKPLFDATVGQAAGLADLDITAIALGGDGATFLADGRTSTVRRIDASGKASTLGTPGGAYAGAWQAERMVAPSGLAILGDRLWVAEDRTLPKRAVAWDLRSGAVVRQVFGNPAYGGPGAGFDPQDPTHWVGEGASWRIDPDKGTAVPTAILGSPMPAPMHWRWIRQDGRTWLLAMGMLNHLDLLQADGTLRPVASWSACHHFSYAYDWHPPTPFVEAYTAAYPDAKYVTGTHGRPDHGPGVLWVDRNGDGAMQREEFEFSGTAAVGGGSWGHDVSDLTIRLPGDLDGHGLIVTLKPDGVDAHGVPRYPHLADAIAAAKAPVDPPALGNWFRNVSSATRTGDLVVLGSPMTCWGADGTMRWRYRNDWSNVHGSHDAPLPEPGVLQGSLFVLGMAPLADGSDAFIINGNHGRFFALTSDGLYLDEMFNDCRVAQTRDANLIGGECFGGVFGRSSDGTYWLQTGGDGFRIYRVAGLDKLVRAQGDITVTAQQLIAAQRRAERTQAATAQARIAKLPVMAKPPKLDGNGQGWSGDPIAWSKQGGRYGVKVRLGRDATRLYLRWEVADDPSPWVNNGSDWTLLFKTGDSVDLQLGTDATADPRRRGPAPGDIRLLIAPMGAENVAVLYRHRVPGTKQGVAFSSPWRSETVDEVKRLTNARIAVQKAGDRYAVEVAVPLADLGFAPAAGATYRADFGVINGDDAGTVDLLRNYWANQATGLVNDVPGEIMLQPALWGDLTVEAE